MVRCVKILARCFASSLQDPDLSELPLRDVAPVPSHRFLREAASDHFNGQQMPPAQKPVLYRCLIGPLSPRITCTFEPISPSGMINSVHKKVMPKQTFFFFF